MRVQTMLESLPYTRKVNDANKRFKGFQVKVPVPRELQAIIGKTALTRFIKSPAEHGVAVEEFFGVINRAKTPNNPDAMAETLIRWGVETAERHTGQPVRQSAESMVSAHGSAYLGVRYGIPGLSVPEEHREAVHALIEAHYETLRAERARLEGLLSGFRVKLSAMPPGEWSRIQERVETVDVTPQTDAIDTEAVIQAWKLWRNQVLKKPVEPKGEATKRRVLARFVDFLIQKRGYPSGFDNFTQCGIEDTKAFRTHLLNRDLQNNTKIAGYDILELNGLFSAAHEHGGLKVDLTVAAPPKGGGTGKTFEAHEMPIVLRAARLAVAELKFGHFLMAYHGIGSKELILAQKDHFRREGGYLVWRIHGTKSDYRVREHVIHEGVLAEGFSEYLNGLPEGGSLFPSYVGRNRANDYLTRNLNKLITEAGVEKTAYCWRHRVSTHFDDAVVEHEDRPALVGAQMSRYLMGHTTPETKKALGSAKDNHAAYYHPSLKKIAEAIATLPVIEL